MPDSRDQLMATLRALEGLAPDALVKATRVAAFLAGTPASAIHLFDDTWQHRIAATGVSLERVPASESMCQHVVAADAPIAVSDATQDERFTGNPFTCGPQPVRGYMSVPLRRGDGAVLGTLCTFSSDPVPIEPHRVGLLQDLADSLAHHLEFQAVSTDLAWSATHDALTGLPNRALLADRLEAALIRMRRHRTPVGLAMVDLDGFKQVNDRYGHAVGDAVLVEVAHRLGQVVRAGDTACRLAGDEFVLLFPELDATGLPVLRERLQTLLDEPVRHGEQLLAIGCSVGLVLSTPQDLSYELLGRADMAMYAAKRARAGSLVPLPR